MSVKVAVRVRPFNDREQGSKCCIRMVRKFTLVNRNIRTELKQLSLSHPQVLNVHLLLTIHFGRMMDLERTKTEL